MCLTGVSIRGQNFAAVGSVLGNATSVRETAALPGTAGEVWTSTDVGLLKSTDYGLIFARVGASSVNTHTRSLSL